MTERIIFLDIDGPMIPYRCLFMVDQPPVMCLFDPVAVSLLNAVCEKHGWKIVLHTSWVKIFGGEYTLNHCIEQGLKAENFHTDAFCDENINWRYSRVSDWLYKHPDVRSYVILDDDPYKPDINTIEHQPELPLRLILINYYEGFMFCHYNEILEKGRKIDEGLI